MSNRKKSQRNFNTVRFKYLFVFIISCFVYLQTTKYTYTLDDAIVIYDNRYTSSGISGIKDIFSHDSFDGFFSESSRNLVAGGRYRPLTIAYFAILYDLFGDNPYVYHLSNVLMYALLCCLILAFLRYFNLTNAGKNKTLSIPLIATLLFSVHPIHTEGVANIKGLDEIWSLLFAVTSMIAMMIYVDSPKPKWKYFILSLILLFIALLSKESAIIFVLLIPMTCYFHKSKITWISVFKIFGFLLIPIILYLIIRFIVIGNNMNLLPQEMMNNPFIKVEGGQYYPFSMGEKSATILFSLGKYVQLLFFPVHLSHDYYPRAIDVHTWSDPEVWLSLCMYLSIIFFAAYGLLSKRLTSYTTIFYILSLLLVSNIFFPIGTHISERFLFTPSLAFCILAAQFFYNFLKSKKTKFFSIAILIIVLVGFISKTMHRNKAWKNNFTLFQTDVLISPNSAKIRNAAGGSLVDKALKEENETEKNIMLNKAIDHLHHALKIHPNYKNAHLLLGNAQYGLKNYDLSISSYLNALKLDQNYPEARKNLIIAYTEGARYFGSEKNNIDKALNYLKQAENLEPQNYNVLSLQGIAYGNKGEHQKALEYFLSALKILPENKQANLNVAIAYKNLGNEELYLSYKKLSK